MTNLELQKVANEVRKDIITEVHSAKSGHPGGSLSAADVFTYLYFEEMNIDPKDPKKPDRDRSEEAGPRSLRALQGTHGSGPVCGACRAWILPEGGSADTAPYRIASAGSSLYAAHAGT